MMHNTNGSGYPFIKSMVFISPKNDSCVTMVTSDECWSFYVFLCFFCVGNDWITLLELSWQCPLKVSTPGLWMYYHSETTTAPISDGLPYLPYIALRVTFHGSQEEGLFSYESHLAVCNSALYEEPFQSKKKVWFGSPNSSFLVGTKTGLKGGWVMGGK